MAFVTTIGHNAEQIEYRLSEQHGCESEHQLGYRTDDRERPLHWIGNGLPAVGIEPGSELTEDQFDQARALMAGAHPQTGEQLVTPKPAVYDDAKLPLEPLVEAVRRQAIHAEKSPDQFYSGQQQAAWRASAKAVDRAAKRSTDTDNSVLSGPIRRADEAGKLAEVAGLDPAQVWGESPYGDAMRNLWNVDVQETPGGMAHATEVSPRRYPVGTAGYDLTLTMPKSYSLLLAAVDDKQLSDRIEGIYGKGVTDTFAWVESETAYQMRGHHGHGKTAETKPAEGFLGWTMTHRAARPTDPEAEIGDPHWHVHVTVANMARADDGKWATVAAGGRDLMRHTPAADQVVQALVRHELGEQLGARFGRSERTGLWELSGYSDEAIQQFSKRTTSITAQLQAAFPDLADSTNGTASESQKQQATGYRPLPKPELTGAPDETLRSKWLTEAAEAGYDVQGMADHSIGHQNEQEPTEVEKIRTALLDPETGLTSAHRRFSQLDALAAVADQLPEGIKDVDQLSQLTDVVLDDARFPTTADAAGRERIDPRVKDLGAHDHKHLASSTLYTTSDVVEAERKIATFADREAGYASVTPDQVRGAVVAVEKERGHHLGPDQYAAVARLAESPASVDTLEGPPGTGKTNVTLRAARQAWEAAGHTVLGASTGGKAAAGLEAESGIASATVQHYLTAADHGRNPLDGAGVFVLDEASMTDDRNRARLYELAADAGAKVVEVGDPHQLRGVGCGSAFGVLHQNLDGPRLETNRRQHDPQHRQILDDWRYGDYAEAVDGMAEAGILHNYETRPEAVQAMVGQWQERSRGAQTGHQLIDGLVMLSGTNETVDQLNQAAQAIRRNQGQVGAPQQYETPDGTAQFGVGDVVAFRQPDRQDREGRHTGDDLLNGVQAVVTDTRASGLSVEWQGRDQNGQPDTKRADIDPSYIADGGLQLGYALTVHRGQGTTIGGAWDRPDGGRHTGDVLFDMSGADANMAYVGLSRHRGQVAAFTSLDAIADNTGGEDRVPVTNQADLDQRAMEALVQRATQTSTNADDEPVTNRLAQAGQPDVTAGDNTVAKHAKQIDRRASQHTETSQNRQDQQEPAPTGRQQADRRTNMSQPGPNDPVSETEQRPEPAPVSEPSSIDQIKQRAEEVRATWPQDQTAADRWAQLQQRNQEIHGRRQTDRAEDRAEGHQERAEDRAERREERTENRNQDRHEERGKNRAQHRHDRADSQNARDDDRPDNLTPPQTEPSVEESLSEAQQHQRDTERGSGREL